MAGIDLNDKNIEMNLFTKRNTNKISSPTFLLYIQTFAQFIVANFV